MPIPRRHRPTGPYRGKTEYYKQKKPPPLLSDAEGGPYTHATKRGYARTPNVAIIDLMVQAIAYSKNTKRNRDTKTFMESVQREIISVRWLAELLDIPQWEIAYILIARGMKSFWSEWEDVIEAAIMRKTSFLEVSNDIIKVNRESSKAFDAVRAKAGEGDIEESFTKLLRRNGMPEEDIRQLLSSVRENGE